jgi:hypothetical protein
VVTGALAAGVALVALWAGYRAVTSDGTGSSSTGYSGDVIAVGGPVHGARLA